jgi:hypothetical protein
MKNAEGIGAGLIAGVVAPDMVRDWPFSLCEEGQQAVITSLANTNLRLAQVLTASPEAGI